MAIFYEFSGEKAFQSEDDYDAAWIIFRRTVNPTGLKIYSVGFKTFNMAKAQIKSIKHDIAAINAALEKIKKTNWKVNLKEGSAIIFPHVVACKMCPQIQRCPVWFLLTSRRDRILVAGEFIPRSSRQNIITSRT
ncbi:hypothetical protein [Geotalea uraniireducens]|uniref:hypothetical protein n=1 Tax=Geotalea uraniireducens TaxID=351604 RepID=UPI00059C8B5E|nr:hypothetical protein [Geotalea uraniireducens]